MGTICLQLVLFCLLFILMVKLAARDSGLNCLYFYPKEYTAEAYKRGLADPDTVAKQSKRFMIPFCLVQLAALLLILVVWNGVTDFKTAYLQSALFLVVMNWFDGIVIDELWVGHSKIWKIPGMEGVPYTKPLSWMFKKRVAYTVMYLILAVLPAGLVVLLGGAV